MAFVRWFGYWAIAAIVITTVWVCLKAFKGWRFSEVLHGGPLMAAIACATFLQIHEPRKLRVMYDEYVLVAISLQMHLVREASVPNEAHYNNGNIIHSGSHVDKRPLLFAFLLSLVHDVSGYRVSNVFVLNALISVGLFWLVFWLGEAIGGRRFGYAGMLLIAGIPLVANVATSGAYDLLNLMLLAVLVLAARRYAEEPTDANQNLLVVTGVLIAQARYESILFLLSIAAVVAVVWWRNRRIELTWLAIFSPLMILLPLLLNFVYISNDAFFENKKLGVAFFDVANLPRNLSHAVYYFFDLSRYLTNSPLVSFAGFAALLLLIVGARTLLKKESARLHVLLVIFAFLPIIVGNAVMILTNFWGLFDDPMASRFSLPLQLFMVLAILAVVAQFKAQGRAATILTVIAGFSIWAWTIPTSGRHHATSRMFASMAVEWQVSQALERFDFRTLVVADSALPLVVNRRPVVPFLAFNRSPQRFQDLATKGDYDQIVFYEMFHKDPETGVETPQASIPPPMNLILEPLFETRFYEGYVSRFSRLVGFKEVSASVEPVHESSAAPTTDKVAP
ncbi:MAG TPA: glycosyltransferase family 39 protein [Opitutaceae bacterium]|nr:glycosyltransferase family 39 protein [Opitutaceae bacterium]